MMQTYSHRGVVEETVTLAFDNGYSLTFEAGMEVAIFVAADKVPEDNELLRLARDAANQVRGGSWSMGALRKLVDYFDSFNR